MKRYIHTLLAAAMVAFLPSCNILESSVKKITPAQVTTASREAAYLGAKAVVKKGDPKTIEQLHTAYLAINDLVESKAVTGAVLRNIVATLPFKQLDNDNARLAVSGVTLLYDSVVGDGLNVEQKPYVLAAATGLRDGLGEALNFTTVTVTAPAP